MGELKGVIKMTKNFDVLPFFVDCFNAFFKSHKLSLIGTVLDLIPVGEKPIRVIDLDHLREIMLTENVELVSAEELFQQSTDDELWDDLEKLQQVERFHALDELAAQAQELNMGYELKDLEE